MSPAPKVRASLDGIPAEIFNSIVDLVDVRSDDGWVGLASLRVLKR